MRPFVVLAVALTAAGALGYLGWRTLESRQSAVCDVCSRPMHQRSAVRGDVDGRRQHFCCAGCALWTHRQTGAAVEITRVTDYISGSPLNASDAVFVVGSQVNLCLRQHSVFDQHPTVHDQSKAPGSLEFDRCSPSILAFSDRSSASEFAGRQGGNLMTYDQLRSAFP